jgi:CheY-like chemotaxis protein
MDRRTGHTRAGTAFHFTARFGVAGGRAETSLASTPTSTKALRIVLAEDHPVNQVVAVRMLERLGHAVLVAGNGREALELVRRERPDVALMDIQMPEMEGLQAASAIREAEKVSGGHLPIVALTAHAMRGDSERFREHGIDLYLAKPIRREELERVLTQAIAL